jgi:hypothetical protein
VTTKAVTGTAAAVTQQGRDKENQEEQEKQY